MLPFESTIRDSRPVQLLVHGPCTDEPIQRLRSYPAGDSRKPDQGTNDGGLPSAGSIARAKRAAARATNLRIRITFIVTVFCLDWFLWLRRKNGLHTEFQSVMPSFRCRIFRLIFLTLAAGSGNSRFQETLLALRFEPLSIRNLFNCFYLLQGSAFL